MTTGSEPSRLLTTRWRRQTLARRATRRVATLASVAMLIAACSSGESGDDTGTPIDEPTGATSDTSGTATTSGADTTPDATPDNDDAPPIVDALRATGADTTLFTGAGALTTFVAPEYPTGAGDPESAALAYLDDFSEAYEVADPRSRFEVVRTTDTAVGVVVRLAQSLDGLEVFGGEIAITVSADGDITGVTGVIAPDAPVAEPSVSADDAVAAAVAATGGTVDTAPVLVAFSPAVTTTSTSPPLPVWQVTASVDDGGAELDETVLVSGVDGGILLRAGIDATDQVWDLSDAENNVDDEGKTKYDEATLIFEMRDGTLTQFGTPDTDAQQAANHFTTSWNYWMDTHSRDGHDDAGGACDIYVHVGVNWRNASSNANCFVRIGDAQAYAQSLDVLAHEFVHSVIGQTSALVYADQSGALNEHYADFFATMVDRSDWVIGVVNRDLSAPSVDRYSEFIVTTRDKGGVHTNSGIGNYVGFLVGDDGTNTHPDTGVSVVGLGRGKAESLWYATLLSLSPMTGYQAWACKTVRAARDMASLSDDDVDSVIDAMIATELIVRIGDRPVCAYTVGAVTDPPRPVDEAETPDTTPDDSTAPTTTATTTIAPTTVAPTTTTTAPACDIVGTWRLRDQEFFDEITRLSGQAGVQIEYFAGDYIMQIGADGSLVSERQEWSFRVATNEGALVTVISSREEGSWSADESTISVQDSGSAEVSLLIEVNGVLQPVPFGIGVPVDTEAFSGTGTYECVGDVLTATMMTDGGPFTARWDRVG